MVNIVEFVEDFEDLFFVLLEDNLRNVYLIKFFKIFKVFGFFNKNMFQMVYYWLNYYVCVIKLKVMVVEFRKFYGLQLGDMWFVKYKYILQEEDSNLMKCWVCKQQILKIRVIERKIFWILLVIFICLGEIVFDICQLCNVCVCVVRDEWIIDFSIS